MKPSKQDWPLRLKKLWVNSNKSQLWTKTTPMSKPASRNLLACFTSPPRGLGWEIWMIKVKTSIHNWAILQAATGKFNLAYKSSLETPQSKKSRKWYPHTEPSKKSIQRIKDKAKSFTDRKLTLIPVDRLMGALNRSVHGWCNYFQYRNSSAALGEVKWYVEERVRTHLRKRHKIRCRGTGLRRFTSEILYQQYGLYPVPTSVKWKHNAL